MCLIERHTSGCIVLSSTVVIFNIKQEFGTLHSCMFCWLVLWYITWDQAFIKILLVHRMAGEVMANGTKEKWDPGKKPSQWTISRVLFTPIYQLFLIWIVWFCVCHRKFYFWIIPWCVLFLFSLLFNCFTSWS